jgi:hypothetical protein
MGLLEDLHKTLERIPGWKRIVALPAEVDALKARIAALEAKLSGPSAQQCPVCRAPGFAVIASAPHLHFGELGTKVDTLRCPSCGHQEERLRD